VADRVYDGALNSMTLQPRACARLVASSSPIPSCGRSCGQSCRRSCRRSWPPAPRRQTSAARPPALACLLALAALACIRKAPPPQPAPLPAAAPAPAAPLPPIEIAPVFYSLTVESHDLGAEILLNDVLVESIDPADHATLSTAVNLWIVPGENRLDVRAAKEHARAGVAHVLRVRVGRRGSDSPHEDVLADFNLVTPDPGAAFAETRTFAADPAPPSALWTHARRLTLDDATRAAAGAVVRDLERTFDRRDAAAAATLLDWKTVDGARAAFKDADLARATLRESLQGLFDDAGYVVDHLTPETLQMELRAGDRLISVARPAGPALQVRLSQGGRFRLPCLIANVDGVFRIVR
jgi:hypothetical protein